MDKRQESEELTWYVNRWKSGYTDQIPLYKFKSEYEGLSSVRCYICDYSPSNKQSLYNPNISYSKANKLFQDDSGKTICYECIISSEAGFKGKKLNVEELQYISEEGIELGLEYDELIGRLGEEDS